MPSVASPPFKGAGQGSDLQGQLLKAQEDHPDVQETAGVAGGQLGWTGNSWPSLNTKWKYTESGGRDGPRRSMESNAWAWRDEVKKGKAWLKFKLISDKKDKKSFCKYIGSKRKTNKKADLLLNGMDDLMMKDVEKTDWLGSYWQGLLSGFPNLCGRVWRRKMLPMTEGAGIRDHLSKLDVLKTMGLYRMYGRLLRELVYVIVMLLSIIFERC